MPGDLSAFDLFADCLHRTMEGRMLAFSGNLNAVMDDPNDEYAAMKNTGISPGGVQFAKKTMVPIDAQRFTLQHDH